MLGCPLLTLLHLTLLLQLVVEERATECLLIWSSNVIKARILAI